MVNVRMFVSKHMKLQESPENIPDGETPHTVRRGPATHATVLFCYSWIFHQHCCILPLTRFPFLYFDDVLCLKVTMHAYDALVDIARPGDRVEVRTSNIHDGAAYLILYRVDQRRLCVIRADSWVMNGVRLKLTY